MNKKILSVIIGNTLNLKTVYMNYVKKALENVAFHTLSSYLNNSVEKISLWYWNRNSIIAFNRECSAQEHRTTIDWRSITQD